MQNVDLRPSGKNDHSAARSNRATGLAFAALFGYVAAAPALTGAPPREWAIIVAATFVGVASAAPRGLMPLTRACTWLGRQAQRVTTPVALWLFLYLLITPIGLGLRLARKDVLGLNWDAERESYWIDRAPPGPAPESMRNQF